MLRIGRTTICGAALVFLALLPPSSSRAQSPFTSLGIGWSARLASAPLDTPAIDAQRVYVPLRSGRLVALSLADGREQWSIDLAMARGIVADAQRLFTATTGDLVAIDARTGRTAWRVPLVGVIAAPAARAGWVLAGAGLELLAFRAEDGGLVWRRALDSPPISPPAIDGDQAFVSLADGSIVSLQVIDGQIAWRSRLGSPCSAPTVAGDRVFTGCEDNFFYSLDRDSGDRRWRWRTGADVMAPAALDGDRVYFASLDTIVRALDFDSGVQRWRHSLDSRPLSGPVLQGDLLLVSIAGQLRAVRIKDGSAAGSFTSPAELAVPAVFAPPGSPASAARAVIVTGAATGDWRVYGLVPSVEPAPAPLKETPGRPLSPDAPPPLREPRPPGV